MKKIYDIVITTGEYTNKQGETKKNYKNIGKVLQKDGETPFLVLDFAPIWSGTASLYKPKDNENQGNTETDLPF